jgi:hypothetical protein
MILAASACGLAIAACGSSGKASATIGRASSAFKFAQCMRSQGLPNFPDPSANGPSAPGRSNSVDNH